MGAWKLTTLGFCMERLHEFTWRKVALMSVPADLEFGIVEYWERGEGKLTDYIAMLCPCGCGSYMSLAVVPPEKCPIPGTHWKIEFDAANRLTLHPSIRRVKSCAAHFWLRENKIIWCSDSPGL